MIAAIRDLATRQGPHVLVVITGGADSCHPDANLLIVEEAKRVGIALETLVVGFQLSESETQAIQNMVDEIPRGEFLAASDESSLRDVFDDVLNALAHPVGPHAHPMTAETAGE